MCPLGWGGWCDGAAAGVLPKQGPRCSIRSRKLYSDATPDYLKMTLLNLPAAVVVRRPSPGMPWGCDVSPHHRATHTAICYANIVL